MDMQIAVRRMRADDCDALHQTFAAHGIMKPPDYLERCWHENRAGSRMTWVALMNGALAGSVHLLPQSFYPPFAEAGIPEINDFNVIPPCRRQGVGSALMDRAEQAARSLSDRVGIGVGLYASYGPAQRLYVRRGYLPDGRGVMYRQQPVEPGRPVVLDDDLNLYLVKYFAPV